MSGSFRADIHINAPISQVWTDITDIASHVEWMDDAKEIRFVGNKRQGVGTRFRCITQVGKFRMDDQIMVTDWTEPRRISIQHDGVVTGNGSFLLRESSDGGTDFTWDENLLFPILLGGPLADYLSRPILGRVWRSNLQSLKDRLEGPPNRNPIRFFAERDIKLRMHRHGHGKKRHWRVDLIHPDDTLTDYATGTSGFAARAAAMQRWITENPPL